MADFDLTVAQQVFKRIQDGRLNEVLYSVDDLKNNPGFASLKSSKGETTPFGEGYVHVIQTGRGGNTSADIDVTEETGNGAPAYDKFLVTPVKLYTTYPVVGDVLDRCKDNGAFINAATKIVKDAMAAHVRKLCILSHGAGSGKIAQIVGAPTSTTITVRAGEARNIERGDRLVAAAAESTGGLRSSTALTVTKRNTGTNVITFDGDPSGLGWQSGDSVFWKGQRNAAPQGYFAWDGATDPSPSESFFGRDRSVDPIRLGGNRFNGASLGLRVALIHAAVASRAEGASPTRARISPEDWATLCIEGEQLKAAVVNTTQENMSIGFKAVDLAGVGPVLYDESMPKGHAILEDEGNARLLSDDGKLVHILSHDGLTFRKTSGDNWAITLKSMLNMVVDRPGHMTHVYNFGL